MFKKYMTAVLAATAVAAMAAIPAQAEKPTSQFGFKGWPYRQQQSCGQTTPTPTKEASIPTFCPEIGLNPGENAPVETQSPTEKPVSPTKAPPMPTEPASVPTSAPQATHRPATQPTEFPTSTKAPSSDDDYTTVSVSAQEQFAWNLLNNDRTANGLSALPLDAALSRIARIKAEDMRDQGYFAHESPTYGSVSNMLRHFGYAFTSAGENIAHHATVEKSQAAFMSSDGHRRNILSSSWTRVGLGVAYDRSGFVYVVQLFAR